ncbi:MAG: bifunctional glutamate N-acetyltransferase/amino-acid acetyltransferase ArgJ [Christensenellaceae bacterium]|jgi:glutamate N-acetyltransferase/amino-acid N-acetyltransferase|nr:bifunctional glutamate N-acetyltransferase/amino-acid acetyltransferase ArgJ [Christensenellaceae bacterium]
MEFKRVEGGVCAPKGFMAAGLHCGVRRSQAKKDIALILAEAPCAAAAVYTQNKAFGAPILVTRQNLQNGFARAVVCNSGNANTGNADGVEKALRMCELVGESLKIAKEDVIVASTGVIGQPLPIEPIKEGISALAKALSKDGGADAAEAIMTTDTKKKEIALEFELSGKKCRIAAMAKGSGMIHPNMATMLSFITSDVAISPTLLDRALKSVVADSYNMISIDGDTSTNDMVSIMASGLAGNEKIESENADYAVFAAALKTVAVEISKMIAGDGEGATKLLECAVAGAPSEKTAKLIAKSVICSALFKAAMFGEDANWGRILCAIGYAEAEFDITKIDVNLSSPKGKIEVCKNGFGVDFSEGKAKEVLGEKEIRIGIDLRQGDFGATAWGCDLTYDYVKINGDYRT